MSTREEHIRWYNNYYREEQRRLTPWYLFMLPELAKDLREGSKVLELGCGQSKGLRFIIENNLIKPENAYGIDQSDVAVNFSLKKLPKAHITTGDVHNLPYYNNQFDFILLMETIEHLVTPHVVLNEAFRVLKPDGKLFISFPNYFNFPWLLVRILAERFKRPNWINLQPLDRIYFTTTIVSMCRKSGLLYKKCIGSNYFPPILYKIEHQAITRLLNSLRLGHISFHPILVFQKKST